MKKYLWLVVAILLPLSASATTSLGTAECDYNEGRIFCKAEENYTSTEWFSKSKRMTMGRMIYINDIILGILSKTGPNFESILIQFQDGDAYYIRKSDVLGCLMGEAAQIPVCVANKIVLAVLA